MTFLITLNKNFFFSIQRYVLLFLLRLPKIQLNPAVYS